MLTLGFHLGQGTILGWIFLGRNKSQIAAAAVVILLAQFGLGLLFSPNFGAMTGKSLKCYSRDIEGRIALFDHCGNDPVLGIPLQPVNSDIAREHLLQSKNIKPKRLLAKDIDSIIFFDPNFIQGCCRVH